MNLINEVIQGFKVTADLVKVSSKGFDGAPMEEIAPKFLEIKDMAGDVVGSWIMNFDKLSLDTFSEIMDHLLG